MNNKLVKITLNTTESDGKRNMIVPNINFKDLVESVKKAAHQVLVSLSSEVTANTNHQNKKDGSIVTVADERMQAVLRDELKAQYPAIAFLGEEMSHEQQQQTLQSTDTYIWCLDPLDGTTNYSNGLPFWAVSLALMNADGVVFGVVYDPLRDECFSAIKGEGAQLNGERLYCSSDPLSIKQAVANIDFKRLPQELSQKLIREPVYRSQRNMGACALEWCWLAAGRFQLYLHGGMKHWDYAAGSLILAEANGFACTLENDTVFNLKRENQSVVAATNENLFNEWNKYLAS